MKNICQSGNENHLKWCLRIILASCASFVFLAGTLSAQRLRAVDAAAIGEVMRLQEQAWNDGNLSAFMQGYWRDDSLRFIGKSGITYGWQPTLDNYVKGYPDKAAMGKLTFTILRVESLGRHRAHVTGRWHLQRAQDAPQGYFTLLWRKIDGRWVIVADHSS